MKKILKICAISILGIIVAIILLSTISHLIISGKLKAENKRLEEIYSKEEFTPNEILEDIVWYEKILKNMHPEQIDEFPIGNIDEEIEQLKKSTNSPISRIEFFRKFAPVISKINDEHTTMLLPEFELNRTDVKLFPYEVFIDDKKVFIKESLSKSNHLTSGIEVISINGISSNIIINNIMYYFSGSGNTQKTYYLQENFKEALFIGYGAVDSFNLELLDYKTDSVFSQTIKAIPIKRNKLKPFYYNIINDNTAVFTYNRFEDPENDFSEFLYEMFSTIRESNINNLIIDLRKNKGGSTYLGDSILSYITTEPFLQFSRMDVQVSKEARKAFLSEAPGFIRWFPVQYFHPMLKPLWSSKPGETASISFDKITPESNNLYFSGNIYVVIGPGSMSSATLLPSTIKKYNLGTLIGENTGGMDTCYGNTTVYKLPNTALEVEMPCGIVYGNTFGSVSPDHRVVQSISDLINGNDTVLEYINNLAK